MTFLKGGTGEFYGSKHFILAFRSPQFMSFPLRGQKMYVGTQSHFNKIRSHESALAACYVKSKSKRSCTFWPLFQNVVIIVNCPNIRTNVLKDLLKMGHVMNWNCTCMLHSEYLVLIFDRSTFWNIVNISDEYTAMGEKKHCIISCLPFYGVSKDKFVWMNMMTTKKHVLRV